MLRMERQLLQRKHLARYRAKRVDQHLYGAAARLWTHGVEWGTALEIVEGAFKEAVYEDAPGPEADPGA